MLYGLVIAIHVIASLVLIAVILLQAGRGGGLSETFGGGSTQTLFGTKTSVFLTRATAVSAVVYIMTCLTLAVMTSHRGKSLVMQGALKGPVTTQGAAGIPQPSIPMPMNEDVEF
ncbi:MAG: preprotein translocase subunit SecG [Candidatus Omnitrophica bacterium]|nr:preprotein translocase subunit SecG [Candidatus Omnitrophota bacterium]